MQRRVAEELGPVVTRAMGMDMVTLKDLHDSILQDQGALALPVDRQLGDVGAGIVAGRIKVLPLFTHALMIESGQNEPFLADDGWHDPGPIRSGNTRPTIGKDVGAISDNG